MIRLLTQGHTKVDSAQTLRSRSEAVGRPLNRQRHTAVSTAAAARVAVLPSGSAVSMMFTTRPPPVTPPYVLKPGREPPWPQYRPPQLSGMLWTPKP